jgi:TonB-dependent receptor
MIEGAEFDRSLKDREQNQNLYSLVAGGEHLLGNWGLDYAFAYSYADEEEPDYYGSDFEMDDGADITLDLSNTDLPQYTITSLENGYEFDTDHFVLSEIEVENNKTSNRDITGLLNLKIPFLVGQNQSELKFGGKFLLKEKDQEIRSTLYSWEGEEDVLLTQLYGDFEDMNFMDGAYKIGKTQDPQKVRDFVKANMNGDLVGEENLETNAEDYQAKEDVFAFYGQSTTYFDKFMLLFGARYEITKIEYTGYEVQWDVDGDYVGTTSATNSKNWNHILPDIHLKYEATPNTNIRAAFTSGLSRPNFYDLVPYKLVFHEDEEMEIGNPDLEPTTAYNFDLLAEHFFQGVGILSGGFFYKSLDKIIYPFTYEQPDDDPRYPAYQVFQSIQGETATLYGFEINCHFCRISGQDSASLLIIHMPILMQLLESVLM